MTPRPRESLASRRERGDGHVVRTLSQVEAPLAAATRCIVEVLDPAAVILFGSRAADRAKRDSDHDLAVLVGGVPPTWETIGRLKLDLEDLLASDVDLVILDSASPIIAIQVLREGFLLACRDPETLERFTVTSLTDYADLRRTRAPIERRLLQVRE
jgi:predicted nucleotidyltransferase